jgi:hypothetical protein
MTVTFEKKTVSHTVSLSNCSKIVLYENKEKCNDAVLPLK